MVRNRLTDGRLFIEQFGYYAEEAWELVLPYTIIRRKFEPGHDSIWEDFEYLTVLARKWSQTKGSAFPRDVKRTLPPWTELDVPGVSPERKSRFAVTPSRTDPDS